MAAGDWLFLKAHDFDAVGLHYSERILSLVQLHRHSCGSALAIVKFEQSAVVDVSDHAAVGDN